MKPRFHETIDGEARVFTCKQDDVECVRGLPGALFSLTRQPVFGEDRHPTTFALLVFAAQYDRGVLR